ncbi:multiple sugar transport system substrate-binding protein [Devosia subaequoris]|uniref:Multiple sugar transport system substrate-binding protein n=1 Tax=Devosia subaequoris TaxID=395930 RepID=A0A7W6ND46_9HYPH|nr:ABC transporter substrate-binding protein [Devosia subaequoris]MBB4053638.1 multiple sugar transport system substrate-binding protein [Devosia subaequoris]MCP1211227.1 ABC transporter substrate-binding protein [Devosia subaequoris]
MTTESNFATLRQGLQLGCAALVLAAAGLAAPAWAQDTTSIKVLNWQPGGPEYWIALVEAFEAENPDITVELETVPFDRYPEVQGPYITTRSGPDVMQNNSGLELYDRRSAYIELPPETLAAGKNLITYAGGCLNFDTTQPCYGLPFGYQGNVMYYNKAVLTQAGLNAESPPTTWEEMDAACEAVKAIGKTCLAHGMTGVFPAYWNFPEIARNFLTEDDMRAVLAGDLPWTDPKMTSILEAMASIGERGWINSNSPSISMLPDGADIFASGNAAFASTIIADAVNWQAFGAALGDENVGAMRWPVLVADAPLANSFSGTESAVFGVSSWTNKQDAALKFVEFIAGTENGNLLTSLGGGIALNNNVDPSLIPESQALAQIQEIIKTPTLHAGILLSGQEADALARGWQEVTLGRLSVPDWAARMQVALEESPGKN